MSINPYIDHTLLRPDASAEDIRQICSEAKEYNFASVCVNGCHTKLVSKELEGSGVMTCTVVGFPLGACASAVKAFEAAKAVEDGADEIDMVINVGALKDCRDDDVEADICGVVKAANGRIVKVILETCLLADDEIIRACKLAMNAGAQFVKTSTGFSTGGATAETVKLMADTVKSDGGKVKASGGIRDYGTAVAMIEAGADRIGTSAGVGIMMGLHLKKG